MEKNKIILIAEGTLEDKVCRDMLSKIMTDIEKLNERTKRQTIQIRDLRNELKKITEKK